MNMFKKRGILGNDQRRQDKATSVQQQQQQVPRGGGQPLQQQQQQQQQQRSSPPSGRLQQSQSHQTREYPEYEHTSAVSSAGLVVDSRTSSDISSEERNAIAAPPALPKHQSNHSQTSLGAPSTTSINGGSNTLTNNNNSSSGTVNNLNNNNNDNNNNENSNNNSSSSSNKKKNDKVVGKRSDFLKGQVDSLTESNRRLEHDNNKLKAKLEEQKIELQRRYEDSQRLLRFKEEEFVKMQNNFHKHVRAIRATDDDLSTIHHKLTMLQAKTSQLPMSLRGSYNETKVKEIIDYFKKKWPSLSDTIDQLTHQGSKLDYPLVCLFVEKLVMEILIDQIFSTPIHIGLSINQHFKVLSDLMIEQQYHEWSTKLRQQLCKLTLKSKDLQNESSIVKSEIVQRIKTEINPIYTIDDAKIIPKLDKIINMAAETSLAMHGQDEPVIFGNDLIEGKSMFDPRLMTLQYGSTMNIPQQQQSLSPKMNNNNNSNTELNQQKDNINDNDNNIKDNNNDKGTTDDDKNKNKENEKDDDDDSDDDDDYNTVQDPTSPIPTPSLVLRIIISPVVYGGDGNGNLTSLLPARVICT